MNFELEPGDWIEDFQIVSVLARSGMGSVFKAHQRTAGRTVVLKVPHLHLESDVVFFSRFQREERIGLRLNHPAIVRVIPFPQKSRPYLVTEYVGGQSLGRLMCRSGGVRARRPGGVRPMASCAGKQQAASKGARGAPSAAGPASYFSLTELTVAATVPPSATHAIQLRSAEPDDSRRRRQRGKS